MILLLCMCVCVLIFVIFFMSDEILQLNGEWSHSSDMLCGLSPHACRLYVFAGVHAQMHGGASLYVRMVWPAISLTHSALKFKYGIMFTYN